MSELKRYSLTTVDDTAKHTVSTMTREEMIENPHGEWIRYEDVERLMEAEIVRETLGDEK